MRPRALAALALMPALGACLASRQDVQALRTEVATMRAAQEEMIRELQRQNALILDSLSDQQVRTRGDLANRLLQIERQMVQIQELTGQGQQQLAQLRAQINQRQQELVTPPDSAGGDEGDGGTASTSSPDETYQSAMTYYRRASYATARAGFEEVVRGSPQHRLAPDAQYYIGETYAQARDWDRAVAAFARVAELYPTSPRAATAVFRSGQVELGRGRRDEARARFNQVVRAYPRSPEATQARTELGRMGAR